MDLFMKRPARSLSANSQNTVLDLVANEAARKNNALKAASPTNRRFSREFFEVGARVIIQDQINKKWEKRGTVISSCPTHTDQGARSYQVQTDDGKLYSRNTRFLTRKPESDPQPEGDQAGEEQVSAE